MATAPPGIKIKAKDLASRDQQLEQGCALLRREAINCGILVTRIDAITFDIVLSPNVPFGLTQELHLL